MKTFTMWFTIFMTVLVASCAFAEFASPEDVNRDILHNRIDYFLRRPNLSAVKKLATSDIDKPAIGVLAKGVDGVDFDQELVVVSVYRGYPTYPPFINTITELPDEILVQIEHFQTLVPDVLVREPSVDAYVIPRPDKPIHVQYCVAYSLEQSEHDPLIYQVEWEDRYIPPDFTERERNSGKGWEPIPPFEIPTVSQGFKVSVGPVVPLQDTQPTAPYIKKVEMGSEPVEQKPKELHVDTPPKLGKSTG